jgi:urease accessory protein
MTRTHRYLARTATLCIGLLPALALAHPGHGAQDGFLAGVLHPANGIDHVAGFFLVGLLASRLEARIFRPMIAALFGLLVTAWTTDSAGLQYAAGFMLTGACLIAAAMTATRAATRLMTASATAVSRRSRI